MSNSPRLRPIQPSPQINHFFGAIVAALLICCPLAFIWPARASDVEELTARFKKEAPQRWAELMSRAKDYQGSASLTEYDLSPTGERKLLNKFNIAWKWNDERQYALSLTETLEHNDPKSPVYNILVARNSRYIFQLTRSAPQDPWLLSSLQIDPDPNSLTDYFTAAILIKDLWKSNCWGLRVFESWLTDIVDKPGFRIKAISTLKPDEDQLFRIAIECPLQDPYNTTFVGWMVLDAKHYWMIREYEYRVLYQHPQLAGEEVFATRKFTYDYDRHGFPVVVKYVEHLNSIDAATKQVKKSQEIAREVNLVEDKDPPEREFTLSAFSLPEPLGVHVADSPSRLYLWISLSGIILIGVGVFFIRRARRV